MNPGCDAIVPLRLRGPTGIEKDVDALVDTGFTASLTLPLVLADALELVSESNSDVVLADGSARECDVYAAEVEWDNHWRPVLIYGMGDDILMGMGLLANHELRIAVRPGGAVEISPLP